ncbi:MAG: glycoside hydrolase family 3 N-terminal domain-containing protein [Anaerolineales bacterium]
MKRNHILLSALFFVIGLPSLAFGRPDQAGVSEDVLAIFNRLTVEEKIGQLFMVTFQGKDTTPTSDIYQLISGSHIGGILLKRENGNWRSGEGEAAAVLALSNGLQQIEADSALAEGATNGTEYVPLFLALPGGEDGYPTAQLATELSDLTSEMSIGATWQPSLAQATGDILGRELALLGINMYLGPSLDVLESPNPGTTGDLGAHTFGGDPFWVGKMGQSYILGIQEGSARKVAVIATHFPGIGASNRSPEEEVATIRKALQDLQLIDLAPFARVATSAPGIPGIADGFMVSHIRYQGLQGDIRTSTRPVSLDPQALSLVMALPEFTSWRNGGGITVSSSLGAQSMRKFYEATGQTYSNKGVALNAFQAGNDILQISNFASVEGQTELQATIETINYFQGQYDTNPEFAGKVDQAVLRILALKKRLYPDFSISSVLKTDTGLARLKSDSGTSAEICKAGATQISPDPQSTGGTAIEPPTSADRIVVLTDSRTVTPCPSCAAEQDIAATAFADTILRLYGPGASGLIAPTRIQSYSFKDLYGYLQGVNLPDLEIALANSTVIVALIQMPSPNAPESNAFQTLLAERAALIRNKDIFVFALGAPYYLDSTEISKVTAYYALYSKHPSCIEVGTRILLGDITPASASPVNIEGVDYDLLTALSPDPNQVIQISVGLYGASSSTTTPNGSVTQQTQTVSPTPIGFTLGDHITFTAGPILDHNLHIVPDGTSLRFQIDFPGEDIPPLLLDAVTVNGMAQADYVLNRQGVVQVSAISEPAKNSTIIRLAVGEEPGFVTKLAPTEIPETTSTPEITPTATNTGTLSGNGNKARGGWDTLFVMILILGTSFPAILYLISRFGLGASRWRILLGSLVGGLAGYDLVVIGFFGASGTAVWGGRWLSVWIGAAGTILGAVLAWVSIRWKTEIETGLRRLFQ